MGLRINTNLMAINARRNLERATRRVHRSMERLSSGLRINRAGDDPAGLAISESLKAQVRALQAVNRGAADGISLIQIAEGGLDTVSDLLLRMRELTTQAQNGVMGDDQRAHLDLEFQALKEEITRIAVGTEFNGTALLDGTAGSLNLHVGAGAGANSDIGLRLDRDLSSVGLGLDGADLLTAAGADLAVDALAAALDGVNSHRAYLGASQNRLDSVIRMNMNQIENLSAANSRIRDVDVAAEMAELTSAQILQQASVAVLAQAQRQPSLILRLLDASTGRWRR